MFVGILELFESDQLSIQLKPHNYPKNLVSIRTDVKETRADPKSDTTVQSMRRGHCEKFKGEEESWVKIGERD